MTDYNNPSSLMNSCKKEKPRGDTLICIFLLGIWLRSQREMEKKLISYSLPKETVGVIIHENTKVKVRSPDGDTLTFDIVAYVFKGNKLAPYLFLICLFTFITRK